MKTIRRRQHIGALLKVAGLLILVLAAVWLAYKVGLI